MVGTTDGNVEQKRTLQMQVGILSSALEHAIPERMLNTDPIVHTDPISVPGWTGAGYILLDPQTGHGAYKITGGKNGNNTFDPFFAASMAFATIGAILDGYSADTIKNPPVGWDLSKYRWAQKFAKWAKVLGAAALLVDIFSVVADDSVQGWDVLGRIAIAMFGFGVGLKAGAVVATIILNPIAAAIVTAAFMAVLTLYLVDFNLRYYSWLRRKVHYLA